MVPAPEMVLSTLVSVSPRPAVDRVAAVVAQGDDAAAAERHVEFECERAIVKRHRPGIVEGVGEGGKLQDATVEGLDGGVGGIGQATGHAEYDGPAIGLDQAAAQIGHVATSRRT